MGFNFSICKYFRKAVRLLKNEMKYVVLDFLRKAKNTVSQWKM